LDVTLDLDTTAGADGTVYLNTGRAGLGGLGIDSVVGDLGQDVLISGLGVAGNQFGAVGSLPVFAQDLNVVAILESSEFGFSNIDASVDGFGTIYLSDVSLSDLQGLGIDSVIAGDANVLGLQLDGLGFGPSTDLGGLPLFGDTDGSGEISFAEDRALDVSVRIGAADLGWLTAGPDDMNSFFANLASSGIDRLLIENGLLNDGQLANIVGLGSVQSVSTSSTDSFWVGGAAHSETAIEVKLLGVDDKPPTA
jgi:hypothetical protein